MIRRLVQIVRNPEKIDRQQKQQAENSAPDQYINDEWDYVITVCDDANEACPVFLGKVKHRMHFGFEDPSHSSGTEEQIMNEFRRVRDEIKTIFYKFYKDFLI